MTDTVRVPISIAAQSGISKITADARDHRVVLTNHGHDVAVVDNAERLDNDLRVVRDAALAVIDAATDLAWQRSKKLSLAETCAKLDIDISEVRSRHQADRAAS